MRLACVGTGFCLRKECGPSLRIIVRPIDMSSSKGSFINIWAQNPVLNKLAVFLMVVRKFDLTES